MSMSGPNTPPTLHHISVLSFSNAEDALLLSLHQSINLYPVDKRRQCSTEQSYFLIFFVNFRRCVQGLFDLGRRTSGGTTLGDGGPARLFPFIEALLEDPMVLCGLSFSLGRGCLFRFQTPALMLCVR